MSQRTPAFGIAVLLALLFSNVSAAAQDAAWTLLTRYEVANSIGKAVIDLSGTKGRFSRVRLVGRRAEVQITRMVVSVAGGEPKVLAKRFSLAAGERTKPIALAASGNRLAKLEIDFRVKPQSKGNPVIEVWGLKAPDTDAAVATGLCWDVRQKKHVRCSPPGKSAAPGPQRESEAMSQPGPKARSMKKAQRNAVATTTSANICQAQNICTPVRIFFGTDREEQKQVARVAFTADRSGRLQLGRAIVTVPKATDRKRGEIPRPQWWERILLRIPPEGNPAKHFTILRDGFRLFANPQEFIDEVRQHARDAGDYKDHAFVFVHGYNVPFDAALYRTAQIAYDLGYDRDGQHVPFGTPFLYSWPSGGATLDYAYDLESARLAIGHLKKFLELIVSRSGAKEIHLIAHSMGNLALLNALQQFSREPENASVKVNQVVLAAPDMDVKEFEELSQAIVPVAKGVTLYASSKDVAMLASRRVHRGNARAGDVTANGPIIVNKVYSIDISALSTEVFSIRHSAYADKRELLSDMNRMFVKEEQPPDKRNLNFERRRRSDGDYWRYAE